MAEYANFYEHLFSRDFFVFEDEKPFFQEKLLQVIWNEQLVKPPLRTAAGQKVKVIHPGIWNVEAGPDFRDAVLVIDGVTHRGSVEIHLRPGNWNEHGHQHDPAYDATILHVVWHDTQARTEFPAGIPLCLLRTQLSRQLDSIIDQVDLAAYPYARKVAPDELAAHFCSQGDAYLTDLFQSAGIARILQKARALTESIEAHGLEEAAYRALADGMGYKSNREPFSRLAELLPASEMARFADSADAKSASLAMLFGTAGLLPDPSQDDVAAELQPWVRAMWQSWWPRRRDLVDLKWTRAGIRPLNTPERRLLALHGVMERHRWQIGSQIIGTFHAHENARDCMRALLALFEQPAAAPLDRFYRFSSFLDKPAALLGRSRAQDLVANIAIPLFFAYCFFRNTPVDCEKGKQVLLAMPKLQDNRTLKEAAHLFFVPPSRVKDVVRNACAQQGLLNLFRQQYG
ncbi:MAG: hypothetical protein ACI8W8_002584 [Rhodothermales bacterium]|jgi:hypothetical protein